MVIREDTAVSDDEPCAKEISANFGGAPIQHINGIAVAVFQRLAFRGNPAVTQRPAGTVIKERHRNVDQADARSIGANHVFGSLRLRYDALQAAVGLVQLLAQRSDFARISSGNFPAKFLRLLLKVLLLLEGIGILEIGPRAACLRHQLVLPAGAALELRDHGISSLGFLCGSTGEEKEHSRNEQSNRE